MYQSHRGVLTWVCEQQDDLQSAIDTPESHHSSHEAPPSMVGFNSLLSSPHAAPGNGLLLPTRWQATQLWQAYLNNVDTLVKLLHVPTTQPKFFAAVNNPKDAPHDVHALLFAIYFAAVTSLRSADVLIMLGQDRQAALDAYQRGLEASLHLGCFLDAPTIVSLQAMAIYLVTAPRTRRRHTTRRR